MDPLGFEGVGGNAFHFDAGVNRKGVCSGNPENREKKTQLPRLFYVPDVQR